MSLATNRMSMMNDIQPTESDLTPTLPPHLSAQQRMAAWFDLMFVVERFFLTGLRRRIGPDGDLTAAYRQWYEQSMRERDEQRLKSIAGNKTHAA